MLLYWRIEVPDLVTYWEVEICFLQMSHLFHAEKEEKICRFQSLSLNTEICFILQLQRLDLQLFGSSVALHCPFPATALSLAMFQNVKEVETASTRASTDRSMFMY